MSDGRWYAAATRALRCALLACGAGLVFASGAFAASNQRHFASPEEAAQALVQAVKAQDRAATLAVLGQGASAWISSGDEAADRAMVARFIEAYDARHDLVRKGARATLTLGPDDFLFAFPIVSDGKRWRFDTTAGKTEMLARRIGENELSAIKVLQAIVDAQMDYASADRDGDGVVAYARKFVSSPGKQDGLYWPAAPGQPDSPLGELLARASSEGYQASADKPTPYHGYYYRLLGRQGKDAPSGALEYVVGGRAIGGFAVVAYPARYGNSGIMSFIVNQDGKIHQADLGPDTQAKALKMQEYNPAKPWSPVDPAKPL
ncbi:MAG: DUF2950 domain-containing protein [Lysobacteraceae bacterium]|nr:MAG: DUF2950 domain-containing protein [Xanthomonadaceae bacterium]